jgi:hypothetical protein
VQLSRRPLAGQDAEGGIAARQKGSTWWGWAAGNSNNKLEEAQKKRAQRAKKGAKPPNCHPHA